MLDKEEFKFGKKLIYLKKLSNLGEYSRREVQSNKTGGYKVEAKAELLHNAEVSIINTHPIKMGTK